eukprot:5064893-Prymnesium_polylepis.1
MERMERMKRNNIACIACIACIVCIACIACVAYVAYVVCVVCVAWVACVACIACVACATYGSEANRGRYVTVRNPRAIESAPWLQSSSSASCRVDDASVDDTALAVGASAEDAAPASDSAAAGDTPLAGGAPADGLLGSSDVRCVAISSHQRACSSGSSAYGRLGP